MSDDFSDENAPVDEAPVADTAEVVEAVAPVEAVVEVAAAAVPARPESAYDRPGRWFVIHSYAGYENKVKTNLESRIASMNMEERIFEVVIPLEDVIEFKNRSCHWSLWLYRAVILHRREFLAS